MSSDDNAVMVDLDKQNAVIIDAQFLRSIPQNIVNEIEDVLFLLGL